MNQCFQNLTGQFGNKELPFRHFPQKKKKKKKKKKVRAGGGKDC
jgi:hypothetical protein